MQPEGPHLLLAHLFRSLAFGGKHRPVKPRRRVPVTAERVAAALRDMAENHGGSHDALAKRAGIERSAVTKMMLGTRLTLENLDAILPALGFDWPDLIDAVQGDFKPAELRRDLEQAIHHIADLERSRKR